MANSKGPASVRNMMYNGKNPLLPPKSPFPSISPSYAEYIPSSAVPPKAFPNPREGNSNHQRTSSENFLIEEQPSWLDELLNEPDTPVRRGGHRRSSSDSYAYTDSANAVNMNYVAQDDNKFKNLNPVSGWGGLPNFDMCREIREGSFHRDQNFINKTKSKPWNSPMNPVLHPRGLTSPRDNSAFPNQGPGRTPLDADRNSSSSTEKQELVESDPQDLKGSAEKKDLPHAKSSETDTKRAKQQFAQRSRVRKLQYIAELERNVQALQAESAEVSAQLEFLNQQSLIFSMENKALKQRLDSLSQEQIIKYLEHEVLERERGRLRTLYQQQQQQLQQPQPQQQKSTGHRRADSRDLDQSFASLTLKPKDTSAGRDQVSGQLHI